MLYLKNTTKTVYYKNNIVVVNSLNGKWLRFSSEIYSIIVQSINNKLTPDELLNRLADDEDKTLMMKVLHSLFAIEAIEDKTETSSIIELKGKKPVVVYLSFTHRCNLSCIHCCVNAASLKDHEFLETAQMKAIIDKILSIKPDYIGITGGEPMVRKDFFELAEYILSNSPCTQLILLTNGTLINSENVLLVSKLFQAIDISIDGVDESSCSKIRGKGVFDKVIKSVVLLKNEGIRKISLSMVLTGDNIQHEAAFDELCSNLSVKPLKRVFEPVGRGRENLSALTKNKNVDDSIKKMDEQSYIPLAYTCDAGMYEFSVNEKGWLYLCHALDEDNLKLTDLNSQDSLFDFITNYSYLIEQNVKIALPDKTSPCKECAVNLFCWHCPAVYYRCKNQPDKISERCLINKNRLFKYVWNETNFD